MNTPTLPIKYFLRPEQHGDFPKRILVENDQENDLGEIYFRLEPHAKGLLKLSVYVDLLNRMLIRRGCSLRLENHTDFPNRMFC